MQPAKPKIRVKHVGALPDWLTVRGARVHNLKSVSIEIPHRKIVVFTGLSGSGKSSLAYDTIFAEGQRRAVQSQSAYARQFLGQFEKPDVDFITGLCSAVAIDQKTASRNPRSTLGTVTDLYDLLRLLYSRIGKPHCSKCGLAMVVDAERGLACPRHPDVPPPELSPRAFSFNLPFGACPVCTGLGSRMEVDPELVVPNQERSLSEGALTPWASDRWAELHSQMLQALAAQLKISVTAPWRDLPKAAREVLLNGRDVPVDARAAGQKKAFASLYQGVMPWVRQRHAEADTNGARERLEVYMRNMACPACRGGRLTPAQLAVTVGGKNIAEVSALAVAACAEFFRRLDLKRGDSIIASPIVGEIQERLANITDVGLDYLAIDRSASSLSGGEAQRIRLATQIGTDLFGMLYVLDEPTVGLHPRDTERLIMAMKRLRDRGNTVVVVEHDHAVINAADWVVELGPRAGERGGEVQFSGPVPALLKDRKSLTGAYLSGRKAVPLRARRRTFKPGYELQVRGAHAHNLKGIDVTFPLGCLVAVTGVSGSGKSTLVNDILYSGLGRQLPGTAEAAAAVSGRADTIEGIEHVNKVVYIDQAPIGRTPRSNPATYTGAFDQIRKVFAATPEARARKYQPGRFSFNVAGGRCEPCAGDGIIKIPMQCLADVEIPCDTCHGARYDHETLQIRYRDRSIADVLEMSIGESLVFFAGIEAIERPLRTMADVGLDYLRLGQSATTLSGGEAQRIKLAHELQRRTAGHTVYLLDEPTRGLHADDVARLLEVLQGLVDKRNTVIVIEHDIDVIKDADWVIDLGPEGGQRGGMLVVQGAPEDVAAVSASHTGRYLRVALDAARKSSWLE